MAGVAGKVKALIASAGAKVRSPAPPPTALQDPLAEHVTEGSDAAVSHEPAASVVPPPSPPSLAISGGNLATGIDPNPSLLVGRVYVPEARTSQDVHSAVAAQASCNNGRCGGNSDSAMTSSLPVSYILSPHMPSNESGPQSTAVDAVTCSPSVAVYANVHTQGSHQPTETHASSASSSSPPPSPSPPAACSSALYTAARAPAAEPPWVSLPKDIFAGSLAGMATTVVGQPLDTIKTRFQAGVKEGGMWHTAKTMAHKEGMASFFRGMSSPLWLSAAYAGAYYASYLQARSMLGIADRSQPAPMDKMLAATIITGACTTVVRGPMDLLKSRIQMKAVRCPDERPYNAMTYGMNYVRTQGTRALFAGFVPTLLRQTLGATMWFIPYEHLKTRFGSSASSVFICGGLASWTYWGSVYPLDTIKTRMQSDHPSPSRRQYHGMLDCASKMIRYEGWQSLFRGFVPCMVRAFPSNAAGIVAYEYARALVSTPQAPADTE